MKIRKKQIIIAAVIFTAAIAAWIVWAKTAATTRVALVDFQPFQMASIVKANNDDFVRYEAVSAENLGRLSRYDFVLGFGMGMRITAEQREMIQVAADKGVQIYIHAATNPANAICNLDSVQLKQVRDYLNNGNKRNYQNLAHYVRQHIDNKQFFVTTADTVVKTVSDVIYHLDENVWFEDVNAYEEYLRSKSYYVEGGARIAIVGGFNDPFSGNRENIDSLIVSLQQAGMNVYPVISAMKRMEFLKAIRPDAVIYFAHGRLSMGQADAAVEWLKASNIPLFAPLSLLVSQSQWEADKMGMSGGFLSQSIVMPELDGAIYPYSLNVQELDDDGLYLFKAIPSRLKSFVQIVDNFVALKRKSNADKRLAIYYFKGAGQSTLAAQGLETVQSLYNFLKHLRTEGYNVANLPDDVKSFEHLLMSQGAVMSTYAEGAFDEFLKNGQPALIEKSEYESWAKQSLETASYEDVVNTYGEAPGEYMAVHRDDKSYIATARIQLGNIALLPQPMAGLGSDAFAIVHGTKAPPPHTYIAAYLWAQYAFRADAIMHFGTHGSLEFTPQKQVALSNFDWPDRLVGSLPHFYYYTIGNIGEGMIAKRRSYATIVSYLTPAFMETETRAQFKTLQEKIQRFYKTEDEQAQTAASLEVKRIALEMGLHRDLRLDSLPATPYSTSEIERIENFAEEIANEKMNGHLYTSGIPYSVGKIRSTVVAMSADPIAYSIANLDRLSGKVDETQLKSKTFFTQKYLEPAKTLVNKILDGHNVSDELICSLAGVRPDDLSESKKILAPPRRTMPALNDNASNGNTSGSNASGDKQTASKPSSGGHPSWIPKSGQRPEETKKEAETKPVSVPPPTYTAEQKAKARAIVEIERTIRNITAYKKALEESPEQEFSSLANALSGGYVAPSSGGDAVANPTAVPTGRNLYSINAEATPSEVAWEKGVALVNATLEQYRKTKGDYPRKVSYTFWSSEFIESEGATIAQALYMLGVEPVRDTYGRVSDLQLIPAERLARPRIDVVIQTSGQFRDLAASRLSLISRAVEMAAAAKDDGFENLVAASVLETERLLVEQGAPPVEARQLSSQRIFGGVNGMYGTGIQNMVTSGDRWENEQEIADTYINNMGAVYGSEKEWGQFREGLLRAVLHNTDVVVQPRQSNTWGALSLDHIYEFMGGMNLAVRNVTGQDPEAYFADYRNRNNVRMQEIKEAIGVEARSTVFNPAYIREVMQGNASSAAQITEVVTNTYGWNVMKPKAIDNEIWDKFYDVYVRDEYKLGTDAFFRRENPQALQEITAVMLETARKGMWRATKQQLSDLAVLHTDLVREFGSAASGFAGSNVKLQDFITQNVNNQQADAYRVQLKKMQTASVAATSDDNSKSLVLKKEEVGKAQSKSETALNGLIVAIVVIVSFVALSLMIRKRRKK